MTAVWATISDTVWRQVTTPSPTPSLNIDPDQVSPGPLGFIAILLIAAVAILLIFDMLRRIRRVNYRAQIDEELKAELAERDAQAGDAGDAPVADTDGDGPENVR